MAQARATSRRERPPRFDSGPAPCIQACTKGQPQDPARQWHPDAEEEEGAADQSPPGQPPGGDMGQGDGAARVAEDEEALEHGQATHGEAKQEKGPVRAGLGGSHGIPSEMSL